MDHIWLDVRYGVRSILRSSRLFAFGVVTLALAIGASTAMFSLYDHLILRPLPFDKPEQLVNVMGRAASKAEYVAVRDRMPIFEQVAAHTSPRGITLSGGLVPQRIRAVQVSSNLFSTLGLVPAVGRGFLPGEDGPSPDPVAILSQSFWQLQFGSDPDVIGRTVILDGQSHEVIGVMPSHGAFTSREVQVWIPLRLNEADAGEFWGTTQLYLIGRLRFGAEISTANVALRTLGAHLRLENPLWTPGEGYVIQLQVRDLKTYLTGSSATPLSVLMGAVVVVLLLACSNLASLFIARSIQRQREWAIKSALGAGAGRLARQSALELTFILAVGGALGLVIAWLIVRFSPALMPLDLVSLDGLSVDGRVLLFAIGATLIAGFVTGLGPIIRTSREQQRSLLAHGRTAGGKAGNRLTALLVTSQIAGAMILLIGAGLFLRTLGALGSVNSGFDADGVLTLRLDPVPGTVVEAQAKRALYSEILEAALALEPVENVGFTSALPLAGIGAESTAFDIRNDPQDPGSLPMAHFPRITANYIQTMGIGLRSGRVFDERDRAGGPARVLVSQSLAHRFFPDGSAVGEQIGQPWSNEWWTIVGIVDDVRYEGLDGPGEFGNMAIYSLFHSNPPESATLAIKAGENPIKVLYDLRRVVANSGAEIAISEIFTADELIANNTSQSRFIVYLLSSFAGAAMLLAMIGTYGMLVQMVSRGRHEIGVRLAVGAANHNIFRWVLRRTLVCSLVGIGIGWLAAIAVSRYIESMLFEVSALDWVTYAAVALVLLATALLSAVLPAREATKTDPLDVLRSD